jgi:PAS domain S-box-containing protein
MPWGSFQQPARNSFALKIAVFYVAFSVLWVITSDAAVSSIFGGPPVAWRVELIAGLIYVAISGLSIYLIHVNRERVAHDARMVSEQRLRRLMESELIGICFWDQSGKVTEANDTFLELWGNSREDLEQGKVRWDRGIGGRYDFTSGVGDPSTQPGKRPTFETEVTRSDGSKIWAVAGAAPLGSKGLHIGYALDVSGAKKAQHERDELENQLRQAHKLQAVGQLAGGVAHDFNNILSVIVGYTSLLEETLVKEDPRRYNTQQVLKTAGKASALISKLLTFSRRRLLNPDILSLTAILEDTSGMLGRLIGEEIKLTVTSEPDLWPVVGDSTQIEQILINLVINARDALPKGGEINITTACAEMEDEKAKRLGISPGRYVMLSVSDNGTGMSDETMAHIFEPFFTTKPSGEGTGLGLAMIYGIVKQGGGHIEVTSRIGEGTTFRIFLPAAADEPVMISSEAATRVTGRPYTMAHPSTILLAEDDDDLRELMTHILENDGYNVIASSNGEQALQLACEYQGKIDLLLTDLRMPFKSGTDLAAHLRDQGRTTKIIYMSGYVDDSLFSPEVLENADGIIEKPVLPEVLLQRVRELMSPEDRSSAA